MQFSAKTKILTLTVTALVAAAVAVWLVFLLAGNAQNDRSGDGYVGYVENITPGNVSDGPGSKRYLFTIRGEERAYIFEFNPDTELLDLDGERQIYYSARLGQQVRVEYDESKTPAEPAQYIATRVQMLEEPRY